MHFWDRRDAHMGGVLGGLGVENGNDTSMSSDKQHVAIIVPFVSNRIAQRTAHLGDLKQRCYGVVHGVPPPPPAQNLRENLPFHSFFSGRLDATSGQEPLLDWRLINTLPHRLQPLL